MDGTILGQGLVTVGSTVVNQVIQVPSGADWVSVRNYTQWGVSGPGSGQLIGVEYFWQYGMPTGSVFVKFNQASGNNITFDLLTSGGVTLYDPTGQNTNAQPAMGNPVATTATTNATRPVVSTANTAGLAVGSVVRLSNTAQSDVNGIDMVVSAVTTNTSFELLTANNALATAPGVVGGAGFYRIINYPAYFYPRRRVITNITQASNAQVSTSIAHGLTVGQAVRFNIPSVSGMVQLNANYANNGVPLAAFVESVVDDYTFTININTTGFTAFTYPTVAQQPSSFPEVTPFGEDMATSLSSTAGQVPTIGGLQIPNTQTGYLADAKVNTGFLGLILGTGGTTVEQSASVSGPAGFAAADQLFWVAGKSTYGGQ